MTGEVVVVSELLLAIMQTWAIASKQEKLTEEQSKEIFLSNFPKFMAESSVPVDPVKKD